jgi:uncharacterized membrane protein YdjX (TVP38/TMEM64 family)
MRPEQADPRSGAGRARSLLRFAPLGVILLGLALGYALNLQDYLSLSFLDAQREALRAYVAANTVTAALLFVGIYFLAVAFSLPAASVLTIFGGFLFGWLLGGALVSVAATAGASVVFLATRSAFGGFLRQRAAGVAKKLAEGFKENAFGYLLVIRLAPVFPFFAVNIAAALFDMSLSRFATATFIGILPGTFAYAYLGQGVGSALEAARAAGRAVQVSDLVTRELTFAFFAIALVALVPTVAKLVRRRRRDS